MERERITKIVDGSHTRTQSGFRTPIPKVSSMTSVIFTPLKSVLKNPTN